MQINSKKDSESKSSQKSDSPLKGKKRKFEQMTKETKEDDGNDLNVSTTNKRRKLEKGSQEESKNPSKSKSPSRSALHKWSHDAGDKQVSDIDSKKNVFAFMKGSDTN